MALHSLRSKVVAGFAAVVLLVAGFITYQISNRGAPEFRRGGEFATSRLTTTTTAGAPPSSGTAATAPPETTTSSAPASAATATTRAASAGPPATTAAPAVTSSTRAATAPGPAATPGPSPPATTPGAGPGPSGPRLPATGTYTYVIDGTETVTLIGTRRLPDRMTTTVHTAPDLAPDQLVFDLRYSDEHEEREIVGFREDGVYFDYEAGSVSFGPRTETSEADYDPPMLQVPRPQAAGASRSGTSQAKQTDGSVVRTEEWKVTVLAQETLTIAGRAVPTWKVDVDRRFSGPSESGTRKRTYWFDPERSMWVKFTEVFHGERRTGGFTATYDSNITATLETFSPG